VNRRNKEMLRQIIDPPRDIKVRHLSDDHFDAINDAAQSRDWTGLRRLIFSCVDDQANL
jgi:hypothetical protein